MIRPSAIVCVTVKTEFTHQHSNPVASGGAAAVDMTTHPYHSARLLNKKHNVK